ncbi:DUF3440 domain-containing protein [Streptococcus equi subsp. zooepidemicus]|uniref:DUF3440 domain-containing protein n=1 Tax=Streptococcus equi TaxID=1336 RepID=UPI001BAEE5B3|nr:DUF3440 domain-containing protein [Streptococcus equi]QUF62106.1 DUF3440 domain-containing protein [Streptococcus equi subsp. zooepidemicus]HEL0797541.1 DUF3440 domain-containing protein [Streptococcus equi subsp. zooepidemicus]
MTNVYEATLERINFMFDNFDNIYTSFSGGKDSTACVHMVCEEARKRGKKVGLLHIDIEAAFEKTMEHVERIYEEYADVIIPIWICLPMTTDNGLSYFEQLWTWWDDTKEDKWVRKMPDKDYIINLKNNPLDFYKKDMTFEDFTVKFGENYSRIFGDGGKTACVVGIRTQESLNRWRAIHLFKNTYKDKKYTTMVKKDMVYNFYPIYDWKTEDIWTYYGRFAKEYNEIYDLMYYAGVNISQMRIDEPFGNESKVGLNMFRVLEPKTWGVVVGRVAGANISNIYDKKSVNKDKYRLPPDHTWESYTKLLLDTLPQDAKEHYEKKFDIFTKWWIEKGSGMSPEDIKTLEDKYPDKIINTHQLSTRGKKDKEVIKFREIVDTIPELDTKMDVLTWKRLALVLLKNDYWCKTLSFGLSKEQIEKRKQVMKKYAEIL